MRIEINIPDEQPEAGILGSMVDPGSFVLELMRRDNAGGSNPAPNYVDAIAKIRQSEPRFKSAQEVDEYLKTLRAEW